MMFAKSSDEYLAFVIDVKNERGIAETRENLPSSYPFTKDDGKLVRVLEDEIYEYENAGGFKKYAVRESKLHPALLFDESLRNFSMIPKIPSEIWMDFEKTEIMDVPAEKRFSGLETKGGASISPNYLFSEYGLRHPYPVIIMFGESAVAVKFDKEEKIFVLKKEKGFLSKRTGNVSVFPYLVPFGKGEYAFISTDSRNMFVDRISFDGGIARARKGIEFGKREIIYVKSLKNGSIFLGTEYESYHDSVVIYEYGGEMRARDVPATLPDVSGTSGKDETIWTMDFYERDGVLFINSEEGFFVMGARGKEPFFVIENSPSTYFDSMRIGNRITVKTGNSFFYLKDGRVIYPDPESGLWNSLKVFGKTERFVPFEPRGSEAEYSSEIWPFHGNGEIGIASIETGENGKPVVKEIAREKIEDIAKSSAEEEFARAEEDLLSHFVPTKTKVREDGSLNVTFENEYSPERFEVEVAKDENGEGLFLVPLVRTDATTVYEDFRFFDFSKETGRFSQTSTQNAKRLMESVGENGGSMYVSNGKGTFEYVPSSFVREATCGTVIKLSEKAYVFMEERFNEHLDESPVTEIFMTDGEGNRMGESVLIENALAFISGSSPDRPEMKLTDILKVPLYGESFEKTGECLVVRNLKDHEEEGFFFDLIFGAKDNLPSIEKSSLSSWTLERVKLSESSYVFDTKPKKDVTVGNLLGVLEVGDERFFVAYNESYTYLAKEGDKYVYCPAYTIASTDGKRSFVVYADTKIVFNGSVSRSAESYMRENVDFANEIFSALPKKDLEGMFNEIEKKIERMRKIEKGARAETFEKRDGPSR